MSETITLPRSEFEKLKETIVISRYKYKELVETLAVLGTKEIQKEIAESEKQIREGKFVTLTQLKNEI